MSRKKGNGNINTNSGEHDWIELQTFKRSGPRDINTNSGEHDWIELQTFKRSGPRDPKTVKFVELVRAKSDDDETKLGRPFPTKKMFSKTAKRAPLSSWMSVSEHAFNNSIRRKLRDQRKKELHAFVNSNPEIKAKFRPGLTRNEYNQLKAEALALMATLETEDSSSSLSMGGVAIRLPPRSSKVSSSSTSPRASSSASMGGVSMGGVSMSGESMGGESMGGESMGGVAIRLPPRSSKATSSSKSPRASTETMSEAEFKQWLSSIKRVSSSSGRGIKSRKRGKGTRKHEKGTRKHGKSTRRNSTKLRRNINKKRRKTNKKK